ncbi:MAG: hypothetical protein IPI31_16160 [Bacteroidetes bacterium]|jgi:hypothetical protein|nr:hypothetical protein [Bacteroidota bacterium]MBK7569355.1 hypothetical protein [Bacteroidota bacterium]MBP9795084.1 hypothetical protein [Chitinophagales bacterium]
MQEIIIKRNYNLYYRMLAISVVALFFIARNIISYYKSGGEGNLVFLIISYVFGFFILLLVNNSIRQLNKRTPALIISENGIIDNISLIKPELVPWSNIVGAEVKKYRGNLQMAIILRDYYDVLDNESPVRSKMTQTLINDLETPWLINLTLIKTDISELHRIILERSAAAAADVVNRES